MIEFEKRNPSEEVEHFVRSRGRRPTQQMSVASESSKDSVLPSLLTGRVDCVIVIEVGELRCGAGGFSAFVGGLLGHA